MSPALAGRFSTTAPPGKPSVLVLIFISSSLGPEGQHSSWDSVHVTLCVDKEQDDLFGAACKWLTELFFCISEKDERNEGSFCLGQGEL